MQQIFLLSRNIAQRRTNGYARKWCCFSSAITPNGFFDPVREISDIRVDSWHICKSAFFPKWCDANDDIHIERTPKQYLQNDKNNALSYDILL